MYVYTVPTRSLANADRPNEKRVSSFLTAYQRIRRCSSIVAKNYNYNHLTASFPGQPG